MVAQSTKIGGPGQTRCKYVMPYSFVFDISLAAPAIEANIKSESL